MKIVFLGTRGYIKIRSKEHNLHTSTLIIYKNKKLLIDCGIDWLDKIHDIKPDVIFITHAHPDHAWGLKKGSPVPVYATKESWQVMKNFEIESNKRIIIKDRMPVKIFSFIVEPFDVIHSIRAPAVGYKITAGKTTIFCAHDIISIKNRKEALSDVKLYIGDGASISRGIIRKKDGILFGHTSVKSQIGWCQKEGVPQMVITHCGTEIVSKKLSDTQKIIDNIAFEKGVNVKIAYDGYEIII